jgi:hypothetical protein
MIGEMEVKGFNPTTGRSLSMMKFCLRRSEPR